MRQGQGSEVHAGGARRAVSTALVLLAVALASLPAAGDAQAAKVKYFGTIDQPQADPSRPQPTIELLVHLDRKKSGELKPDHVNRITTRNMWFQCSDGQTWYPGTGYEKEFFSYPGVDNHPWGVKKRRFSGTADDDVEVDRLVASGRIPSKGPATGTVRLLRPAEAEDAIAPCDSGTFSFMARQK